MTLTTAASRKRKRIIAFLLLFSILVITAISIQPDIPVEQVKTKYATATSRFMSIDGMQVHYRDEGDGPILIMTHGSNCSLQSWDGWQQYLRHRFRVISFDLPGHGLTGPNPKGEYDYATMARVLDQFTNKLHINKFSLAGNSMGGAIALYYTTQHPDKVEKLVLIDSLGYQGEIPPVTLRMWGWPLIGRLLTVLTPRFVYAQTLKETYGHKERVSEQLIDRYYELLLREGNREATRKRFIAPTWDIESAQLKTIKTPTLVMWGGKDPWFNSSFGRRFAHDIPNASVRLYPDLGHLPMEEDPEATARDAATFLADSCCLFLLG